MAAKPNRKAAIEEAMTEIEARRRARDSNTGATDLGRLLGIAESVDRLLAANPNADTDLLTKLSHSSDKATRKAVVLNANAPKEALMRLARQFPGDFFRNTAFDLLLLEDPNLLFDLDRGVLKNILKRPECPESFMRWAAAHGNEAEQLAIAANPNAPKSILENLALGSNAKVADAASGHEQVAGHVPQDPERSFGQALARELRTTVGGWWIQKGYLGLPQMSVIARSSLAEAFGIESVITEGLRHPACPPLALEAAARDEVPLIRLAASANPACPENLSRELQEAVAHEQDPDVLWELLELPTCSDAAKLAAINALSKGDDVEDKRRVLLIPQLPQEVLMRLTQDDDEIIRLKAFMHPSCPTKLLEEIALSKEIDLRGAAVTNPASPAKVLILLAQDHDDDIRRDVTRRPDCPLAVLESLGNDPSGAVRAAVAENHQCPSDLLDLLARDPADAVRKSVAQHSNCPPNVLQGLAADANEKVRARVAAHPSCPGTELTALARDPSSDVRLQVASNPSCPEATFTLLAGDSSESVRAAIGKLPQCPLDVMLKLSVDSSVWVRRAVAGNHESSDKIVELLKVDPDARVREAIAGKATCPRECLKALAEDAVDSVRLAVGDNAATPAEVISLLAGDQSEGVRARIARHPDCPRPLLDALAHDDDEYVRRNVAYNASCSQPVRDEIAGKLDGWEEELISNPQFFTEELLQILGRNSDPRVRLRVAQHAACPKPLQRELVERLVHTYYVGPVEEWPEFQARVRSASEEARRAWEVGDILWIEEWMAGKAANQQNTAIRVLGLSHQSTSQEVLAKNAKRTSWLERAAVARNRYTPATVLSGLASDVHGVVRGLARENLAAAEKASTLAGQKQAALANQAVDLRPFLDEVGHRLAKARQWGFFAGTAPPAIAIQMPADLRWRGLVSRQTLSLVELVPSLLDGFVPLALVAPGLAEALAENPALSREAITKLARSRNATVRIKLARHRNAPRDVLLTMAKDKELTVKWAVAENPSSPGEILEELAQQKGTASHVAANRACPPRVLAALAQNPDTYVRCCVAGNMSCPEILLQSLAQSADKEVRGYVAGNAACPKYLLVSLSSDEEEDVRAAVAANASCPEEVAAVLASDASDKVRDYLSERKEMEASRRAKADSEHEADTHGVATVAANPDRWARLRVAKNELCPVEVLMALSEDPEQPVRQAVALNPACPGEVRDAIVKREAGVLQIAIDALRMPLRPLDWSDLDLSGLDVESALKDKGLHLLAILHPSCDRRALEKATKSADRFERLAAALNPSLALGLARRLLDDTDEDVGRAAAKRVAGRAPPSNP